MPPNLEKQANPETPREIPSDAVLAALDKVVGSEAFGKTERPARFLRHLVETSLRGEAQSLKESVLGTDVFDRPASWGPRLDPIVRQEAARLRKRLAKYYENGGADAQVRIELPVGSYVPVFRSAPVEIQVPAAELPVQPRQLWPYLAAAILCIALGLITWRVTHREAALSVAVLPFTNLSGDPANQYFSDGLTDEIIDSLARVKTLRVIARSSTYQGKGKTTDIREVGRLLNVTNVSEGSVESDSETALRSSPTWSACRMVLLFGRTFMSAMSLTCSRSRRNWQPALRRDSKSPPLIESPRVYRIPKRTSS
jgi:hypothetical protein